MTRERPLIGVTGRPPRGLHRYVLTRLALRLAGADAVLLSPDYARAAEAVDGLILGGGDDIGAELYAGHPDPSQHADHDFDRFELALLQHAWRHDMPLLGICRGMQLMNVAIGGTLYGEVAERFPRARRTRTILPLKIVRLRANSRLFDIVGRRFCRVNGLHHQAVDQLGPGLAVVATDRVGIIEAVEDNARPFCIGVQWHPELLLYMRRQRRLFRALVAAARTYRRGRPLATPEAGSASALPRSTAHGAARRG